MIPNIRKYALLFGVVTLTLPLTAQSWTLTTLAGSTNGGGYVDANGLNARFSFPHSLTVDSDGTIFASDRGNHVIRKITPSGDVSTLAGLPGAPGSADGAGNAARFNFPAGITIDRNSGNLYVADSANHTIRKVTRSGVVTTLAGAAGKSGSTDGDGAAARFAFPQGVAVDQSGFVWVADTSNHVIRRIIGSSATVSTFAGGFGSGSSDGTGTSAHFNFPFDIAVDGNGDFWIADSSNNTIRKLTREGVVTTVAGSPFESGSADGVATAARFDHPWGIEVAPNGDVWIADSRNDKIRKLTTAGVVSTVAGSGSYGTRDGAASQARFAFPTGLAFDTASNAYVADRESQVIRRISTAGAVTTLAGSAPTSGTSDGTGMSARLFFPGQAVADSAGNIFFVDSADTVRKITPEGVVTTIAGLAGQSGSLDGVGSSARFNFPNGIALDANGNLWVADTANHTIRKVTQSGVVTTVAGSAGTSGKADGVASQARFNNPWGLGFDLAGNLYIADSYNHLIRIMDPAGVVTAYAGTSNPGSSNGAAHSASFDYPLAVAVDTSRNVFVADWGNNQIRKISAAGSVTTFAGSGSAGFNDGSPSSASFNGPYGIAVDAGGNVFVADTNNDLIRKVTAGGLVLTILGRPVSPGNVDGTFDAARIYYPQAVAVDLQGHLIVSDTYNHAIRIASLAAPQILSFTANPLSVKPGGTTTLSWSTTDATNVSISPGLGSVAASASLQLTVQQTTTYTLTATGPGGTATARVTVSAGETSKRRAVGH